ncbi:MAG: ATP-binding protein, partial [Fibrobacteraceae bacterium]|nr:ATP-binding protein [Fibrobacteraceae bacterium]
MIDKEVLKQVMVSNQRDVERYRIVRRELPLGFDCRVFVGVRRAGKSFMLYQKMQECLVQGHGWGEMLYLNFEDDRLAGFVVEDFESILECHAQLSSVRPWLFLDEVQNIDGWEKFARRLADAKYKVWITGSNAKMLSSEIMTTLGGRYLATEVFPYSFAEYMKKFQVPFDEVSQLATESRGRIFQNWEEYLRWGGLPESVDLPVKRDYLSSTFQKIYLSDIALRNKVSNPNLLRLMLRKMAENVCQPVSYNRMANVLSSVGGKVSMPTVAKYIEAAEDAWVVLRLRNMSAAFADKEKNCKYYFVDNGILDLFLIDNKSALLENLVALELFRRYGHDLDNERVFFYSDKVEVDFYIPEEELAIQVSYNISGAASTYEREMKALGKITKVLPCKRRLVLTNGETKVEEDDFGKIEVMPAWKFCLTS